MRDLVCWWCGARQDFAEDLDGMGCETCWPATSSNPVPTPSHLVPDGATEPPGDPVHGPRPGTPVGGAGGDGVALSVWGPGSKITTNPVPGRGHR